MNTDSSGTENLNAMALAFNYAKAMQSTIIAQLGLPGTARGSYIDFGSGIGDYANAIALDTGISIIGCEPAPLNKGCDTELVSNCESLADLPDGLALGAYSLNVFEHIQEDAQVLRKLAAKVKPGGFIFLLVPAHLHLWTAMDDAVGHVRRYSAPSLRELGVAAGLRLVAEGWFDKTGYLATRAFQLLTFFKLRSSTWDGHLDPRDVAAFDVIFKWTEPMLSLIKILPGKNRWVLLQANGRPKQNL